MAALRAEAARKAVQAQAPGGLDGDVLEHLAELAASLAEDAEEEASMLADFEEAALPLLEDAEVVAEAAADFCKKVASAAFGGSAPAAPKKAAISSAAKSNALVYCPNLLLMYGGSPTPLLKNATLELIRGHRYGVIGANGTGKTTMMSRIASKDIVGFPQELRVVHLRHETILRGVSPSTSAKEYARLKNTGSASASDAEVARTLREVGFDNDEMLGKAVGSLSGGWQMRLALACAMAQKANLLLLDEPTNHLDVQAVSWLVEFINNTCVGGDIGGTALIVSHDSVFLDQICTDIIHFTPDAKLNYHPGDFETFKREVLGGDEEKAKTVLEVGAKREAGDGGVADPMAVNFADADSDKLVFPAAEKFPGVGVGKDIPVVLTLKNATFKHDGAEAPVLNDISVQVNVQSRIAIVGKNGSGKSTLLSILARRLAATGLPLGGELWQHPSLRLVYVSQHADSHLKNYMSCTPYEYIQLRFKKGYDCEAPPLPEVPLEKRQQLRIKSIAKSQGKRGKEVEAILSRQMEQVDNQTRRCLYEVKWKDLSPAENTFEKFERLKGLGVEHLVHQFNDMMSIAWGDAPERPLTDRVIISHLTDFGLPEDAARNRRVQMLSSGQKAKLLMAASFWTVPHMVCFDEPTNYLDADTVKALATALRKFKGGYMVVSHNQDFIDEIADELWEVAAGKVTVRPAQAAANSSAAAAPAATDKAVGYPTAGVAKGKAAKKKA